MQQLLPVSIDLSCHLPCSAVGIGLANVNVAFEFDSLNLN